MGHAMTRAGAWCCPTASSSRLAASACLGCCSGALLSSAVQALCRQLHSPAGCKEQARTACLHAARLLCRRGATDQQLLDSRAEQHLCAAPRVY